MSIEIGHTIGSFVEAVIRWAAVGSSRRTNSFVTFGSNAQGPGGMRATATRCWHCAAPNITVPSSRYSSGISSGHGKRKNCRMLPLSTLYDAEHGGMGRAPKFPKPLMLSYLLRYWKRTGDSNALEMVEHTLQAIRRGGIYDHVGFGFHRYATDEVWLLPHFEKMLYNQALLLMVYTEAYQATGKALYAQTAHEIATYVLRDMTAPEGGFYSAEDADSEGEEGVFYLWTTAEVEQILGVEEAALFNDIYTLMPGGNFDDGKTVKQNIPHLTEDMAAAAQRLRIPEATLRQRLEASRKQLFAVRKSGFIRSKMTRF